MKSSKITRKRSHLMYYLLIVSLLYLLLLFSFLILFWILVIQHKECWWSCFRCFHFYLVCFFGVISILFCCRVFFLGHCFGCSLFGCNDLVVHHSFLYWLLVVQDVKHWCCCFWHFTMSFMCVWCVLHHVLLHFFLLVIDLFVSFVLLQLSILVVHCSFLYWLLVIKHMKCWHHCFWCFHLVFGVFPI